MVSTVALSGSQIKIKPRENLNGICMFSWCLCGFLLGTLISYTLQKDTNRLIWNLEGTRTDVNDDSLCTVLWNMFAPYK